jgi:hypothetical protein
MLMWNFLLRWVKFQEDVEEGGKRWSKPFVPALQFTALAQLRDCLHNGIVMLDLPANSLDDIIGMALCNSKVWAEINSLSFILQTK